MTQRNRKFAGIFLFLGLLIVYPAVASAIYIILLEGMPTWLLLTYFAIVGTGWAIPAGMLVKWMARPDAGEAG